MPFSRSVLSGLDSATPVLHTIYAYLTGLLLALVGIEYQGLNTSPFKQHPALIILFLIAIMVYAIALFLVFMTSNPIEQQDSCYLRMVLVSTCHISGTVACELLLLVLVSPVWGLVINVSSFLLVLPLILQLQSSYPDTQSTEEQTTEMQDLEAATAAPDPQRLSESTHTH